MRITKCNRSEVKCWKNGANRFASMQDCYKPSTYEKCIISKCNKTRHVFNSMGKYTLMEKIWIIKNTRGASAVAQWDQQCLGSAGTQVRSLARHSGLWIHCCHSCGLGSNYGSDHIPGPGTPYATGQLIKKKTTTTWKWRNKAMFKYGSHLIKQNKLFHPLDPLRLG